MSDSHAGDISKHRTVYISVFVALAALTVVTVLVARLQFAVTAAIGVGLVIAALKGALVALFFMHLSNERKLIYGALLLTVLFFIALLLLPFFTLLNSYGGSHIYS